MGAAILFIFLVSLGLALVVGAGVLSWRLALEPVRPALIAELRSGCLRGVVVPAGVWGVMNIGLSFSIQPFMPVIQQAQGSGLPWAHHWVRVFGAGFVVICSYWSALTLGGVLLRTYQLAPPEVRPALKGLALTCCLGLCLPAAAIFFFGGWALLGVAVLCILAPAAGYAPTVLRPAKAPPMYARAIARMKFGKYSEAEWEIIRELEKAEDDFDGWMMLAELYAKHFRDVRQAEQAVLDLCAQARLTPSQLSVALHRLADWHLEVAGDPVAARRALQQVCQQLPGSHLAHMAQLRIQQIPQTAAEWKRQQEVPPIPLPVETPSSLPPPLPGSPEAIAARLNELTTALDNNPADAMVREQLARLLAAQPGRIAEALEHINWLLHTPAESADRRAGWLSLAAAWHLRYRSDPARARELLERVVTEFPDTAQASAAQKQLWLLDARGG